MPAGDGGLAQSVSHECCGGVELLVAEFPLGVFRRCSLRIRWRSISYVIVPDGAGIVLLDLVWLDFVLDALNSSLSARDRFRSYRSSTPVLGWLTDVAICVKAAHQPPVASGQAMHIRQSPFSTHPLSRMLVSRHAMQTSPTCICRFQSNCL